MANELQRIVTAIDKKTDNRVKSTSNPKVVYGTDNLGNPAFYELDSFKSRLVRYNLTGAMDGITQTFDIDESITSDMDTFITYMGVRFEKTYHYTIDDEAHTLTTKFENAPDKLDGRMLFLFVGSDVAGVGGEIFDVTVNGVSVVDGGIANITIPDSIDKVVTQNTDTVKFSGTGTTSSPLKADVDLSTLISEQEWIDDDIELTRAAALSQFQSNPNLVFVFIAKKEE